MRFDLVDAKHDRRQHVEEAISAIAKNKFGADIRSILPPLLTALFDDENKVQCALGLRFSGDGFSYERFLDLPIEQVLTEKYAEPIRREQIVEIGSLGGIRPGLAMRLFDESRRFIVEERGIRVAVFIAIRRLRPYLQRAGYRAIDLVQPPCDRAGILPTQYGSYFTCDPWLMALHADHCLRRAAPRSSLAGEVAAQESSEVTA